MKKNLSFSSFLHRKLHFLSNHTIQAFKNAEKTNLVISMNIEIITIWRIDKDKSLCQQPPFSNYIKIKNPILSVRNMGFSLPPSLRGQPKYDLRSLLRVPCLNLLIAFSLIWRTRSLVRPNLSPISSNVIS